MDAAAPALHPVLIEIADLALDPHNARTHNERNLAGIGASLAKFSQRKAIVVNRRTMTIEAGNGTVEAAIAAGATQIVAVLVDDDDETAAAYAIADNRTAELAGWDLDQLGLTVAEFPAVDWGALGWAADDLAAALRAKAEMPAEPEPSEGPANEPRSFDEAEDAALDIVPEPPAEPVTQRGETITLGPHVLHCADCLDVLRSLPDNSVDAIVTDPPYGLSPDGRARTWDEIEALRAEGKGPKAGFMGRAWDAGVPGVTWARECLRVLKPGGHLVAFSATRTYHRLACAVEDAGFEMRDMVAWLYYSGFPKSHDVSKAIDDLHGAEREVVSRETTRWTSTGRNKTYGKLDYFETDADGYETRDVTAPATDDAKQWSGWGTALKPAIEPFVLARKPLSESTVAANVLRWGTGAINVDACRMAYGDKAWPGPSEKPKEMDASWSAGNPGVRYGKLDYNAGETWDGSDLGRWPANIYACPKPATSERNKGTDALPKQEKAQMAGAVNSDDPVSARFRSEPMANIHPTVKPVRLMRWLLQLVTPPGGTVVEPFGGSGTTLVAASALDCRVIAAEMEPAYCDIIRARVEHALR